MSSRLATALCLGTGFALAFGAAAASAQDRAVHEVIRKAQSAYGPADPKKECQPSTGEGIVVCAMLEDQEQFRLRSDEQAEDDYARETMYANDPQAPDVAGPGIFKGPATASGCIPGITCPPPRAIDVDFSALPEAPPGSDADRIGQGLAPRGSDEGDPVPAQPEG